MNTANMAASAAASLSVAGVRPRKRRRHSSPTPLGGLRPNGGKYGPFTLGARERFRLAWRHRVDAAARAWGYAECEFVYLMDGPAWRKAWTDTPTADRILQSMRRRNLARVELSDALAAPRPWRSPRKPDPRNHYPRRHRRACKECRCARGWLRMSERVAHLDPSDPYRTRFVKFTRNPHGRSDR